MLKKFFIAMMAIAVMGFGFVACSDDDDEDEESGATVAADVVAGTHTVDESFGVSATIGGNSLGSKDQEGTSLVITKTADDKVSIKLPAISYTDAMQMAEFTIENVVVATTDNENYTFTLGEFTSTAQASGETKNIVGTSVEGTFVKSTKKIKLTAIFKYGAMPLFCTAVYETASTSAAASVISSSVLPPSKSVYATNSASDYYGTWSGSWTILGISYATSVIVGENTFYYQSTMMSGSYEYVGWEQDSDGNWVCCGSHSAGNATIGSAAATVTFKNGLGYFNVGAMSSFVSPAVLTQQ